MNRLAVVIVTGLLSIVDTGAFAARAAAQEASAVIDVKVSDGQLTVDVRDAPLAEVLRAIGAVAGLDVTLRGDLDGLVTQSFVGVSLEEGIKRLARGHSVAVTFAPSGASIEVWVLDPGSAGGPVVVRTAPASTEGNHAGVEARAVESAAEATLAPRVAEIQRLAADADEGGAAALARLAEIGASDTSADVRHQAVAALGRLRGPAVEPALVAALADDDATVRIRAVRGLRGFGSDAAARSLVDVLVGDANPQVRLAAVAALTSLPGPTMLQGLVKAASDSNDVVRETAMRGLAWWKARLPGAP